MCPETGSGEAECMTETRESRWRRRWLRSETGSGEAKSGTEAHEPRLRRRWLYP